MIDFEVIGLKEAINFLEDIQLEWSGRKGKLYRDIGTIMHDSIELNFAEEGRPRWPDRISGGEWPLLDKTGRMRDEAASSALKPWRVQNHEHDLDIETPDYGDIHQNIGMKTKGKRIKRRFVKLTAEEGRAIGKRILNVGERS